MTRWAQGEAEVEQQIADGHLQQVTGGRSNGAVLLDKAQRTLDTAATITAADPNSAYTLAYDAARHAGTALWSRRSTLDPRDLPEHRLPYVVVALSVIGAACPDSA